MITNSDLRLFMDSSVLQRTKKIADFQNIKKIVFVTEGQSWPILKLFLVLSNKHKGSKTSQIQDSTFPVSKSAFTFNSNNCF